MKKSRVFLLVLIPLLVGAIAGYMVGKRGRSGYSDGLSSYTQRVQIGKLLIFADNDASNFAVIRCVTQDGQTKYRWLLREDTDDEGTIYSYYYGAKCPLKDPNRKHFLITLPPIDDDICHSSFTTEDETRAIVCTPGTFSSNSIFIDRDCDGLWDSWHKIDPDSGTYTHYTYDRQKMGWVKMEEEPENKENEQPEPDKKPETPQAQEPAK